MGFFNKINDFAIANALK